MQPRILVVDDDPSSLGYFELALRHSGYEVRSLTHPYEALLVIERELPSLVITDLEMPGISGLELLAMVKERWPGLPVILVTVKHDAATIVEAVQAGAANYLVKPVAVPLLQAAISRVLAREAPEPRTSAEDRSEEAADCAPEIIGTSEATRRVKHSILQASRADVHVLIVGETGTGKELVAHALHRLYAPSRPFITHNCASTPEELFDATFFGHRRGAFTGADRDQPGLLLQADGGVLFLDEVECLSLANQAKLLRVLDSGELRPVGGERTRTISVRFVAATNRPPAEMIATRELREDFYYRLRGFEIALTRLSERPEDINGLTTHFLQASGKHVSGAALRALTAYPWPGNVRQLRNVLRAACARAPGAVIEPAHLELPPIAFSPSSIPPSTSSHPSSSRTTRPPGASRASDAVSETRAVAEQAGAAAAAPFALHDLERQAIIRAMAESGGNIGRAAAALGIHRSTLRRKLRDL
jgi:DNA-binding NtrC family response regulator